MSSHDKRGSPQRTGSRHSQGCCRCLCFWTNKPKYFDIPASAEGYAKGIDKIYETMLATALQSITE